MNPFQIRTPSTSLYAQLAKQQQGIGLAGLQSQMPQLPAWPQARAQTSPFRYPLPPWLQQPRQFS